MCYMPLTVAEKFRAAPAAAVSNRSAFEPPLERARVVIAACHGLNLGGPRHRCLETARALTAHDLPAVCIPSCSAATLSRLRQPGQERLDGIIFIKQIPSRSCTHHAHTLNHTAILPRSACIPFQHSPDQDGALADAPAAARYDGLKPALPGKTESVLG